jgi:hypothetical protein
MMSPFCPGFSHYTWTDYWGAGQLEKYAGTYQLSPGEKYLVRLENNQLQIAAEGQTAINHLLEHPDKESLEHFDQLNQRTAKIVEGISKNDYSPLKDALAAIGVDLTVEKAKERYGVRWVDWRSLVDRYGPYKNYEVLGTLPAYDNQWTTFIRVNFERGSPIYRWYWWNGGLERIYADEVLPATNPLVPQSPEVFTSVDLYMNTRALVHFDFKPDGTVGGLSIGDKNNQVRAMKTKGIEAGGSLLLE